MPEVHLENVPQWIYQRLVEHAQNAGVSLEHELIDCLEAYFLHLEHQPDEVLAEARRNRAAMAGVHLTDADLAAAREDGRP